MLVGAGRPPDSLCSVVQTSTLGCPGGGPHRSLLAHCWLGTHCVVGFPSCAQDYWHQEFRVRDFPDCAGAGLGPSNLLAASDNGVIPPHHVAYLLEEVRQMGSVPRQSTTTMLAAPPRQQMNKMLSGDHHLLPENSQGLQPSRRR